jgi:hypothetical protein
MSETGLGLIASGGVYGSLRRIGEEIRLQRGGQLSIDFIGGRDGKMDNQDFCGEICGEMRVLQAADKSR